MIEARRASRTKGWLVMAATAGFLVGAVYLFTSLEGAGEPGREAETAGHGGPGTAGHDAGGTVRDRLLRATAADLGVRPLRGVYGVLMERGYAKGVATVVALTDGTASMYLSTGAQATGGKAYAPARLAAIKLCELAADSLGDTSSAHEFPAPAKGRVRFYVLASEGVRTAEGDVFPARDAGPSRLAPLMAAGDALLDGLREATSKGVIR
jgi:hypothetical protein